MTTVHVMPNNDLIEHADSDDCVCGPTTKPVEREDGTIAWICVHHSADGREN